MALFTMAVEFNEVEAKMNCLTPELIAYSTYELVRNYWKELGINVDVDVYAEFNTVVS